jgi:BirA family biotin operon repressor/biotin-[acetyl-CoA-carboxylase] ligase
MLADGALHSGERLAAAQAVSRSAIWKAIGVLQSLGVEIEAAPHSGYRLAQAVAPLDAAEIVARLSPEVRARLRQAEAVWTLESTNAVLLARSAPPAGQFDFLTAEYQVAGRGRRARQWFAPPGGALCLSLGWSFDALPAGAAALSLAVGVCARRALERVCATPVQLKWPNDLYARDRKLGGILIELRAESAGPATVVIGIGVNCALGAVLTRRVQETGTEPIDLAALGIPACDRNQLAAALLDEIVRGVLEFAAQGLTAFASEWAAADALTGHSVAVSTSGGLFVGQARGIDADGALRVEGKDGLRRFNSGEVTLRAQG